MPKEFSLKVLDTKQETPDVKSVFLDCPDDFGYKPGQYAILILDVNDTEGNTRALSIASSPTENGILIFSTKISQTPFKQKFNSLKKGDIVKIKGPFGSFVPDESAKEIVLLGGGIGITPFRDMVKYAADKKSGMKVILFYSNRMPENIVYREEWHVFEKQNPNFTLVNTVTDLPENVNWEGKRGRSDEKMIKEYVKDIKIPVYYICGPPGMVEGLSNLLASIGVSKDRIRIEKFAGY